MFRRRGRPGLLGTVARRRGGGHRDRDRGRGEPAPAAEAGREAGAPPISRRPSSAAAAAAGLSGAASQYQAPPPPAPARPGRGDDLVGKIQQLAGLRDAGVLSEDEFAAAKGKLLGMWTADHVASSAYVAGACWCRPRCATGLDRAPVASGARSGSAGHRPRMLAPRRIAAAVGPGQPSCSAVIRHRPSTPSMRKARARTRLPAGRRRSPRRRRPPARRPGPSADAAGPSVPGWAARAARRRFPARSAPGAGRAGAGRRAPRPARGPAPTRSVRPAADARSPSCAPRCRPRTTTAARCARDGGRTAALAGAWRGAAGRRSSSRQRRSRTWEQWSGRAVVCRERRWRSRHRGA